VTGSAKKTGQFSADFISLKIGTSRRIFQLREESWSRLADYFRSGQSSRNERNMYWGDGCLSRGRGKHKFDYAREVAWTAMEDWCETNFSGKD